jgi:alcohol dehydrogenase (cytochrome c)
VWDYDGVNENILFELDGRRLLAHFDKNGYLYILDRTSGEPVNIQRFVRTTWGEVDPQTGRIDVRLVPTVEGTEICPGPAGGKEWTHAAYSPRTGLLYAPVIELCGIFKLRPQEFREGLSYFGGGVELRGQEQWGEVKAIDPLSGLPAWAYRTERPVVASVLATAGDVVFAGEATGELTALHARTGEVLWRFQTGSGIHGSPITYSVDGVQFVAVPSGWGGWMKGFAPDLYGAPRGAALFVFALPGDRE